MMVINVTQDHIRKGIRHSCGRCPIALAFKDSGFGKVVVGSVGVQLDWETGPSVNIPSEAVAFIQAFDGRKPVEPFSFEIEVPVQ